jgi:hypothetical protein
MSATSKAAMTAFAKKLAAGVTLFHEKAPPIF